MTDLFPSSLEFVLAREGGLVNDPRDPGGITFKGVSLRAVVGVKDAGGKLDFDLDDDDDVDADDIAKLAALWDRGMAGDLIERFYRERYWEATHCQDLPWPLCLVTFDSAVNHGPRAAAIMLQKVVGYGLIADGVIGPVTLRMARRLGESPNVVERFLVERSHLYHRISVARGDAFFKGWMRRLFALQARCLAGKG